MQSEAHLADEPSFAVDRPLAPPLRVDPVVEVDDHLLAGWKQSDDRMRYPDISVLKIEPAKSHGPTTFTRFDHRLTSVLERTHGRRQVADRARVSESERD